MINRSLDTEIIATGRQIAKNIDEQAQITLELCGKGRAIEDYLDNPSPNRPIGGG